jgi:hypothetical protein
MATKLVELNETYLPKTNDKDIIVDIKIGDGQEGSYSIFLGSEFIEANAPANLGKKKDIIGKTTIISVTIVDQLQETNMTSITAFVTEGSGKAKKYGPYKAEAENHLDTVIYTLKLLHQ